MIDTSTPLHAALADFGVDAVIGAGPEILRVIPDLDSSDVLSGEVIHRSGPTAIALLAAVQATELTAGNAGNVITINATDYTILAIDPDGQGGAVLSLSEVG